IRAFHVTGVQTCALPISTAGQPGRPDGRRRRRSTRAGTRVPATELEEFTGGELPTRSTRAGTRVPATGLRSGREDGLPLNAQREIGRASCRERLEGRGGR